MTDFNKFFKPSSLVFLGASSDPRKWGWRVLNNILTGGFQGNVYPINPNRDEILNRKVYKCVADVPEVPDLAIILVPPQDIVIAIQECVNKGIKAGVVITAGFAEIGEKGVALQTEMIEIAGKGGMRLIGPNCFGILSPSARLYAQMPPIYPTPGPVAIVSQSGNISSTIARKLIPVNRGISNLISTGNEADLHVEDFIEYLGKDERTRVILSYVEGFKNGRSFFYKAREASRQKPIVMIKVGETEAGAAAAKSHTAALSGSSRVFEGICRQAGIVRVQNIREMINVCHGFLSNPVPKGRRVAIATMGGGWGVMAADSCARLGLDVVKLDDRVLKELDAFLPGWWSRNNPVDLVGGSSASDQMIQVAEVLAKYDGADSVICLGLPYPMWVMNDGPVTMEYKYEQRKFIINHYREVFKKLRGISKKYSKPVIVAADLLMARRYVVEQDIMGALVEDGSICYSLPHEAATVAHAMTVYGEFLRR